MNRTFRRDERGISAIEMAILLPLLILLVMAVIEFGLYFVKYQIATRAVATISDTIQRNPAGATHGLATQQGLSFLDLTTPPNFICAKSYTTNILANAGLCNIGEWQTSKPAGSVNGAPYYVAVRAFSPHDSITPFTALSNSFPPPIDVKAVVMVNTTQQTGIGFHLITSGSGYWTVPAGVTRIKVSIIGGGGGYTENWRAPSGGATVIAVISGLTPGSHIAYNIGSKGGHATNGQNTSFNGLVAGGGLTCPGSCQQALGGTASTNQTPSNGVLQSINVVTGGQGRGTGYALVHAMPGTSMYPTFGRGDDLGNNPSTGGAVIIEW